MNKNEIKLLIETEDPVIVEIGANNGSDTKAFLDTFSKGSFYAFEPDPRAYAKLDKITDPRLTKYEMAIGNEVGWVDFHQSSGRPKGKQYDGVDWDYSGSIKKPKNHIPVHPWCKFETILPIEITKLDIWVGKNGIDIIDFLWVDSQGAEEDVIKGALNTLRDKVKFLYTEYEDGEMYEGQITKAQILKMLPEYDLYKDFGTDLLLINRKFL